MVSTYLFLSKTKQSVKLPGIAKLQEVDLECEAIIKLSLLLPVFPCQMLLGSTTLVQALKRTHS
jgi:hypothetical protein